MRSLPFLVVLGAGFARGVSPEQRDLEFEDTSENFEDGWSDIVERHDNEFFVAQYPLTQTDNPLVEINSIGPNLDAEGTITVDQVINSVGTPIAQNPLFEAENQANMHTILKRVPDFLTFNIPVYRSGFKTSLRPYYISETFTQGTEAPVTVTKKVDGPVTVTISVVVTKSATQFTTVGETEFILNVLPATATEELLTFAYTTRTRYITINGLIGKGVYFTLTSPVTVTVTEGVGPTVTVTKTFTSVRSIVRPTFIVVTTRLVARPNFAIRRVTTSTTTIDSVLPSDLVDPPILDR